MSKSNSSISEFDEMFETRQKRMPNGLPDAAVFVNDTLELCWASAKSLFKNKATPELALAIYDRIIAKMPPETVKETKGPGQ